MGYYTRVLSKAESCPAFEELRNTLTRKHPQTTLVVEEDSDHGWETLVLLRDGEEVAAVDRNPVLADSDADDLGREEIREFL